jgi:cytochrome c oxidase subunit III
MSSSEHKPHDYHLIDPSPWPIMGAFSAFIMAVGAIVWMKSLDDGEGVFGMTGWLPFAIGFSLVLLTMFVWWRDIVIEAQEEKAHTPVVQIHLRYGMIMFIMSEVMFFVAWFWAYFDASLFPGVGVMGLESREAITGGHWPPMAAETDGGYFKATFDPWHIPLLNTIILLTSGATVTYAHHALLDDNRKGLILGLALTVILGITFSFFQAYEYMHAAFTFGGHIYGATFFMATGFHGVHVIIGTIFLTVCLIRAIKGHFTPKQHFGFEAAAWYWHFVDVVWLFLFASIYVWGAGTPAVH